MMTKSSRIRWAEHGKNNKCLTNSGGKSESNGVNVKPRFKWKEDIKSDFKQDGTNWIDLAQDNGPPVVSSCAHDNDLYGLDTRQRISCLASQDGLCSMEVVSREGTRKNINNYVTIITIITVYSSKTLHYLQTF
jgi:hypothetical protein